MHMCSVWWLAPEKHKATLNFLLNNNHICKKQMLKIFEKIDKRERKKWWLVKAMRAKVLQWLLWHWNLNAPTVAILTTVIGLWGTGLYFSMGKGTLPTLLSQLAQAHHALCCLSSAPPLTHCSTVRALGSALSDLAQSCLSPQKLSYLFVLWYLYEIS